MNILKINNIPYKYEFFWRSNKDKIILDSNGKPLPYPVHHEKTKWNDKLIFLNQLRDVEIDLHAHSKLKFYKKKDYKDCLICGKKHIVTGLFTINRMRWENSMKHYINKHNIKPSEEFIDFIYRYYNKIGDKTKVIARINGVKIVKSKKKYLKLDRNQILIMDALMEHGGEKVYRDRKNKKVFRYSEHSGLLDFNNSGLEKIIISGNTTRVDAGDDDIFLPKNMLDALDYEYIFHTHPPTPKPGGRAEQGILYEFPSISDVFHFIDHYNDGRTQGSIVMAPEGMYIIRKLFADDKPLHINEDKFYHETIRMMWKCQDDALKKYGTRFSQETFYSKISQDLLYINRINEITNKYKIHIDYYPRIKDNRNRWVIDTIYLPVYSIELKQ